MPTRTGRYSIGLGISAEVNFAMRFDGALRLGASPIHDGDRAEHVVRAGT
jgi:hypothetical protein